MPHNRRLVVATSVVALAGLGSRAYAAASAARRTVKAAIPPPAPVVVLAPKAAVKPQEPELVSARATNGMVGFVRKADLEANPRGGLKATSQLIPVYARDGRTVIGKYLIEPAAAATPIEARKK